MGATFALHAEANHGSLNCDLHQLALVAQQQHRWIQPQYQRTSMDELLASFGSVSLDNRAAIVNHFSRILGTDEQTANFFLESHQDDIGRAVDAYLQLAAGNKHDAMVAQNSPAPSGVFEDDSSWDPKSYPANTPLLLTRRIQNNGPVAWPEGCEIAQADGTLQLDPIPVQAIGPGEITSFNINAHTPGNAGVYNVALRLRSPLHGFCSEPIWLIFEVCDNTPAPPQHDVLEQFGQMGSEQMDEDMDL